MNNRTKQMKLISKHTTNVAISKTLNEIHDVLRDAGATYFHEELDNGRVTAIVFGIPVPPDGRVIYVQLPANPNSVARKIMSTYSRKRRDTQRKVNDQAERIAWRLVLEQLKITITQIQLEQMDARQAWMGQLYDTGSRMTMFQKAIKTGLLELPPGE